MEVNSLSHIPKEEKAFADDQQAEFILSDSDNNSPTIQATEEDSDNTSFKAAYAENEIKPTQRMKKLPFLLSKTTMNYVISYGISCQRLTLFSKQQMEKKD